MTCDCPQRPGRVVVDPDRHAAWHAAAAAAGIAAPYGDREFRAAHTDERNA